MFLPYMGFWFMMLEAQYFTAKAAQYASADQGEQLKSYIWSVLTFPLG